MILTSTEFVTALQSPIKNVFVRVTVFDHLMKYISEFTQQVNSDIGYITADSGRAIRRSLSLTLDNSKGLFTFGEGNLLWLNKRIKVEIGLRLKNGKIEYIPQGVYCLTQPVNQHTIDSGKSATIELADKAFLYTDKRGRLKNHLKIATNTKVTDAIKIVAQGAYETQYNFDDVTATVPYELNYEPSKSRWEIIQELAAFAKCTIFFDVHGYLRLKKIDLNAIDSEPIVWTFKHGDAGEKFYAGNIRRFDETNLANSIRVLGGNGDVAAVLYDLVIDEKNSLFSKHPYSIQQIGEILYEHNNGNPDSLILNAADAKYRAKYELMRRAGYDEQITLYSAPHFLLEPEDVIWIEDQNSGVMGAKYVIKSLTIPISPQLMSIECLRQRKVIENWDFI